MIYFCFALFPSFQQPKSVFYYMSFKYLLPTYLTNEDSIIKSTFIWRVDFKTVAFFPNLVNTFFDSSQSEAMNDETAK